MNKINLNKILKDTINLFYSLRDYTIFVLRSNINLPELKAKMLIIIKGIQIYKKILLLYNISALIYILFTFSIVLIYSNLIEWEGTTIATVLIPFLSKITPVFITEILTTYYMTITSFIQSTLRDIVKNILMDSFATVDSSTSLNEITETISSDNEIAKNDIENSVENKDSAGEKDDNNNKILYATLALIFLFTVAIGIYYYGSSITSTNTNKVDVGIQTDKVDVGTQTDISLLASSSASESTSSYETAVSVMSNYIKKTDALVNKVSNIADINKSLVEHQDTNNKVLDLLENKIEDLQIDLKKNQDFNSDQFSTFQKADRIINNKLGDLDKNLKDLISTVGQHNTTKDVHSEQLLTVSNQLVEAKSAISDMFIDIEGLEKVLEITDKRFDDITISNINFREKLDKILESNKIISESNELINKAKFDLYRDYIEKKLNLQNTHLVDIQNEYKRYVEELTQNLSSFEDRNITNINIINPETVKETLNFTPASLQIPIVPEAPLTSIPSISEAEIHSDILLRADTPLVNIRISSPTVEISPIDSLYGAPSLSSSLKIMPGGLSLPSSPIPENIPLPSSPLPQNIPLPESPIEMPQNLYSRYGRYGILKLDVSEPFSETTIMNSESSNSK